MNQTEIIPQDTQQERKKNHILRLLRDLINEVEDGQFYGEFGVTFTTQNGRIGHYEVNQRKTFK